MIRLLSFFVAGAMFAAGLVLSGMTQPAKVVGFLDVTGAWDPSLAFVMAGAIAVHLLAYRWMAGRSKPVMAARSFVPTRRDVDVPLLLGAATFGVGWGLAGFCPGPGIVSAAAGSAHAGVFVVAMLLGQAGFIAYERLRQRRQSSLPLPR